jgi:hypothetical protein
VVPLETPVVLMLVIRVPPSLMEVAEGVRVAVWEGVLEREAVVDLTGGE